MIFRPFYRFDTGCAAYVFGCAGKGFACVVVDYPDAECQPLTCEDLECAVTEVCEVLDSGGAVCRENGCDDELDCPESQHCDADGICVAVPST